MVLLLVLFNETKRPEFNRYTFVSERVFKEIIRMAPLCESWWRHVINNRY